MKLTRATSSTTKRTQFHHQRFTISQWLVYRQLRMPIVQRFRWMHELYLFVRFLFFPSLLLRLLVFIESVNEINRIHSNCILYICLSNFLLTWAWNKIRSHIHAHTCFFLFLSLHNMHFKLNIMHCNNRCDVISFVIRCAHIVSSRSLFHFSLSLENRATQLIRMIGWMFETVRLFLVYYLEANNKMILFMIRIMSNTIPSKKKLSCKCTIIHAQNLLFSPSFLEVSCDSKMSPHQMSE